MSELQKIGEEMADSIGRGMQVAANNDPLWPLKFLVDIGYQLGMSARQIARYVPGTMNGIDDELMAMIERLLEEARKAA